MQRNILFVGRVIVSFLSDSLRYTFHVERIFSFENVWRGGNFILFLCVKNRFYVEGHESFYLGFFWHWQLKVLNYKIFHQSPVFHINETLSLAFSQIHFNENFQRDFFMPWESFWILRLLWECDAVRFKFLVGCWKMSRSLNFREVFNEKTWLAT